MANQEGPTTSASIHLAAASLLPPSDTGVTVEIRKATYDVVEDAVVQAKKDFAQQIAVARGMEYHILRSTDADKRHYRVLM